MDPNTFKEIVKIYYSIYPIVFLFIVKWSWFRVIRKSKKQLIQNFLQRNKYSLFIGVLFSWITLFIYLVVIRLYLGWYFQWHFAVFLIYFFTSIILDSYYFGVVNNDNFSITSKLGWLKTAEKAFAHSWVVNSYRIIKLIYFRLSVILSFVSLFLYLAPLPTIDSIRYNVSRYNFDKDKMIKVAEFTSEDFDYYYPHYEFYGYFIPTTFSYFDKILVSKGIEYTRFYEKKWNLFMKPLFEVEGDESTSIFVNDYRIKNDNTYGSNGNINDILKKSIATKNMYDNVFKELRYQDLLYKTESIMVNGRIIDNHILGLNIKFYLDSINIDYLLFKKVHSDKHTDTVSSIIPIISIKN
jgi:hypothetical protein